MKRSTVKGPRSGPSARLTLNHWRAVRRLLIGGDIGFAESYMDGDWSSPDLTALIELAARNHETMMPSLIGSYLAASRTVCCICGGAIHDVEVNVTLRRITISAMTSTRRGSTQA